MKIIVPSLVAAVAIIGATSAAQAEPKQTLMPESEQGRAFMDQFGFSQAVIHDGKVYMSGVIAGPTPEGMTDEESYARTFTYLGTILKRAGSSWDDVLDITTYHVDIDQSMPPLAAAKNRFVKAPFPAWTAIDVDRLYTPDGLVEIKITARLTPKADEPAE